MQHLNNRGLTKRKQLTMCSLNVYRKDNNMKKKMWPKH